MSYHSSSNRGIVTVSSWLPIAVKEVVKLKERERGEKEHYKLKTEEGKLAIAT